MEVEVADLGVRAWGKLAWIMKDEAAAAALIGAFVTVAGLFVALVPVYFAIRQNRAERQWRRSEVVRGLLWQLTENPNIALVARILDWREGPAPIPEPFRPMFDASMPADDRARPFFEINWKRFIAALPVDRTGEAWRAPDLFMYRTCFDSFCSFIQSVADDIRTIGAREAEYADLSFYCYRVVFPKDGQKKDDPAAGVVLRRFIEAYYNKKTYDVILRHAELYAITHPEDGMSHASALFPTLFHHRSALKRARQRRENRASVSPRDVPRRQFHASFRSWLKARHAHAAQRGRASRHRWHRRYRRARAQLRWFFRGWFSGARSASSEIEQKAAAAPGPGLSVSESIRAHRPDPNLFAKESLATR